MSFYGAGLYDDRQPLSFSAQVTDGNPDSFVLYVGGKRYGGNLTGGNITVR